MKTVQELRAVASPPASAAAPAADPLAGGMGKVAAIFALGVLLGAGGGLTSGRLFTSVAPEPAVPVVETAPEPGHGALVAGGRFIQADRNDPLHVGAGKVSVFAGEVVLDADFQVPPGPDYRVLLVPKAAIRATADVANTMYVDLGPLRAFKGGQSYAVPDGVDLTRYPSVVIWCRAYSVLISPADLSFGRA